MTNAHFTGSKYEMTRELDIAQIAKLVRADIAAAIASGELPAGLKCSVRISRYSMGRSLSVIVTEAPFAERCTEWECSVGRSNGLCMPWLTRVAYNVTATLEAIVAAYNYDRSEPETDYYCERFHGSVGFNLKAPKVAPARELTGLGAARNGERGRRLWCRKWLIGKIDLAHVDSCCTLTLARAYSSHEHDATHRRPNQKPPRLLRVDVGRNRPRLRARRDQPQGSSRMGGRGA